MPTIYYFDSLYGPPVVYYLSGYLHTEIHTISNWIVPGTLNLED